MSGTPDGQTPNAGQGAATPPTTPPARSPADAGGEPIRDYGEVKRIIGQRDTLKTRNAELEAELQQLKQRDADAAQKQKDAELELLRKEKAEREQGDKERTRQERRKGISDEILASVHDDHKAAFRLMLPGLHEEGKVDLYAEATDAGTKARDALAKDFPQYFKPAANAPSAGNPGKPGPNMAGIKFPSQLSEEQIAKMSDEDFKAAFVTKGKKYVGV